MFLRFKILLRQLILSFDGTRNAIAKTILFVAGIATFGPIEAEQIFLIHHERVYTSHQSPLVCSDHAVNLFGSLQNPMAGKNGFSIFDQRELEIQIYRVESNIPITMTRGNISYRLAYRDIELISDPRVGRISDDMIEGIMGRNYRSRLIDSLNCVFQPSSIPDRNLPSQVMTYSKSQSSHLIFAVHSDIYIQFDTDRDSGLMVENAADQDAGDGIQNRKNVSALPSIYPWVVNFDLKKVTENEPILVIEKSKCEEGGNFFVFSTGHLLAVPPENTGSRLEIVRSEMYAANHYYGKSGDPTTRHVVENSIDTTHFWCIPKKEFCYKRIEFGNYAVNVAKDQAAEVDANRVYNLRLGIVSALQMAVTEYCSNENYSQGEIKHDD